MRKKTNSAFFQKPQGVLYLYFLWPVAGIFWISQKVGNLVLVPHASRGALLLRPRPHPFSYEYGHKYQMCFYKFIEPFYFLTKFIGFFSIETAASVTGGGTADPKPNPKPR